MNIEKFFEQDIEFPQWILETELNSPLIMIYCVHQFIRKPFSQKEAWFHGEKGATIDDMQAHFASLGLEVEIPSTLSHVTVAVGLKTGKFTFLCYKNPKSKRITINFVKKYEANHDRLVLFDNQSVELSNLEIIYFFTVQVPYTLSMNLK